MDKKEKKRDVAVFANMLKELMQTQEGDMLQTLDRDIQHFIYGRIALMVKHNQGQPIGSIGDIGAVVGASLADVTKEFVRGRNVETDKLDELFTRTGENMLMGYNSRRPKVEVNIQAPMEEKQPVVSEQ
jgi:hypothetical protein